MDKGDDALESVDDAVEAGVFGAARKIEELGEAAELKSKEEVGTTGELGELEETGEPDKSIAADEPGTAGVVKADFLKAAGELGTADILGASESDGASE